MVGNEGIGLQGHDFLILKSVLESVWLALRWHTEIPEMAHWSWFDVNHHRFLIYSEFGLVCVCHNLEGELNRFVFGLQLLVWISPDIHIEYLARFFFLSRLGSQEICLSGLDLRRNKRTPYFLLGLEVRYLVFLATFFASERESARQVHSREQARQSENVSFYFAGSIWGI